MKSSGISLKQITVTPARAALWLRQNHPQNRKVSRRRVVDYAHAMRKGKWALTHQGVAFDTNGYLIDGQHRLQAVVAAGVNVPMLVTTGLPANAVEGIDLGRGRNLNDVLTLTSSVPDDVSSGHMSTRASMLYKLYTQDTNGSQISKQEFDDIMGMYNEDLLWSVRKYPGTTGGKNALQRKARSAPVMAGIVAVRYLNPTLVDIFTYQLDTGTGVKEGSAVAALRDLLARTSATTFPNRMAIMYATIRAVWYDVHNQGVEVIHLRRPRNLDSEMTEILKNIGVVIE